ncbi:MAG TPA: hypothetical protein VD978_13565 [Azospirillum sp.]|nr:hypothetical protein [Azospirillum sp.]
MAGKHEQSPEHKKAHDLADKALDAAMDGDTAKAKKLADQAKQTDPKIADEMNRELEADRRQAEAYRDKRGGER